MNKVEMAILGHSGCKVEVIDNFDELCVRKSTLDINYMARLRAQIAKQKKFSSSNTTIRVPEVYGEYQSSRVYFAEMQYIRAQDIFRFLSVADKDRLDRFFSIIEGYLTEVLVQSEIEDFPASSFLSKLDDVEFVTVSKIPESEGLFDQVRSEFSNKALPRVPIGCCHGDLTLSNVLIEADCENIYLIDFLDSFIESPIQDIVKIKQDLVYYWSIQKSSQDIDLCRTKISFAYLNEKLDNFVAQNSISLYAVNLFQVINLMRILPYTKDNELTKYLLNCISIEVEKLGKQK